MIEDVCDNTIGRTDLSGKYKTKLLYPIVCITESPKDDDSSCSHQDETN